MADALEALQLGGGQGGPGRDRVQAAGFLPTVKNNNDKKKSVVIIVLYVSSSD